MRVLFASNGTLFNRKVYTVPRQAKYDVSIFLRVQELRKAIFIFFSSAMYLFSSQIESGVKPSEKYTTPYWALNLTVKEILYHFCYLADPSFKIKCKFAPSKYRWKFLSSFLENVFFMDEATFIMVVSAYEIYIVGQIINWAPNDEKSGSSTFMEHQRVASKWS